MHVDSSARPADAVDVSARDLTELRRAEARFRAAFATPAIGMALVAEDGTFVEVNAVFAAMLGYTEDELRGRTYASVTHPADLPADLALARELFGGRRSTYRMDKRYVRKDGEIVWGRLTGSLIPEPDGPALALGLVEDITAEKRAESEREDVEHRFRALVETMPAVAYIWESTVNNEHSESLVTYTSPQVEGLLGYTAEEWERDPMLWAARLHPDDREAVLERTRESERDGVPFEMEYRYLAKDGRVVWVRDSAVLLDRTPDGRPWRFQGVMMDVTDRKLAEESLAETSERLNAIVEGSPLAIVSMDLDGIVRSWNPAAERILGWPAEAAVGRFLPHVGVEHRAEFERLRDRILSGADELVNTTLVRRRRDGTVIDVALSHGRLRDRFGRVVGLIAVIADVTETRDAQRGLAEAERRYRTLVERLPAVTYLDRVYEVDDRVRFEKVYVSPQVETILGFSVERWTSELLWEPSLHPEDRDRVLRESLERVGREESIDIEYRLLAADGHVVWVREQSTPLRQGDELYWQGVMYDVTATKETELALRSAEERFRTLVEQIPAVTFTDDTPDHAHLYISPQVCDLIGVDAETAMADPDVFRRHVHPDDADRVWSAWDETVAAGRPFEAEYRVVHEDGTVRWVWERSACVSTAAGPIVQGVIFDVTDRKQAEDVLRQSEAEVRNSLQLLKRADEERRHLLRHVIASEAAERGRLAEGIEDRSLQDFTAVGLRLESIRRNLDDPEQRGAIDRLGETVQQALVRLRHLLVELRPRELETDGLAAALDRYVRAVAPAGVSATVRNGLTGEPEPAIRGLAYRIAQDAVASAIERVGDGTLVVDVEGSDDGFVVRVGAQGRALEPPLDEGVVVSLRERAGIAGGWIRVAGDGSMELWFPGRLPDAP